MGGDDVKRISVDEARRKVQKGAALLVCGYEDEAKCREMGLEGGITLAELERRMTLMPADKGLIFYCGSPAEATAAGQAAKYQSQGFVNAVALGGGVDAWRAAGFPMARAA